MELLLSNRIIKNELPALVMGIVNVNEDSFFAQSRGGAERAFQLEEEGADLLDLGAESTRPGSSYISEDEEIKRLVPVIEKIRRKSNIPICVDTRKFAVMKAAREAGADILNDISALEDDERLAEYCANSGISVILMHKRGIPSTMQNNTTYHDIFSEVDEYLSRRADFALKSGIKGVVVDAGIGFGKSVAGNLELVKKCGALCDGRFPVLMALSRKSFIGAITSHKNPEELLSGTLAANLVAIQSGASIVRVHDVLQTVDSIKILDAFCKI